MLTWWHVLALIGVDLIVLALTWIANNRPPSWWPDQGDA